MRICRNIAYPPMRLGMSQTFIQALRVVFPEGTKQQAIAEAMLTSQATVSRWFGGTDPTASHLIRLIDVAEERDAPIDIIRLLKRTERRDLRIPVDGHVGAGAVFFPHDSGPERYVSAPAAARAGWRAMEIKGQSLGDIFNGWLAYYDADETLDASRMDGKLCVVRLPDQTMTVKLLKRTPGRKDRFSLFAASDAHTPPMHDQEIEEAHAVKLIAPDV
jgi:SOS-response transcriptional repressor LexA